MKRKFTVTAAILLLLSSCATEQRVNYITLKERVSAASEGISSGSVKIQDLERFNGGGKGYYYLITSEGRVIYHPKKGLIGSDFSRYDFVKRILEERNGCISSDTGGVPRIILFRSFDRDDILCYTIEENQVPGSEECGK